MPNLPLTVNIDLSNLQLLLSYYNLAVATEVGDLGIKSYETLVSDINRRSKLLITPEELESLVYHMKQVVFERLKITKPELKQKTYYHFIKKLADDIPQLFKTLPSGEIVFVDFEDREKNV